eukprot:g8287.t1
MHSLTTTPYQSKKSSIGIASIDGLVLRKLTYQEGVSRIISDRQLLRVVLRPQTSQEDTLRELRQWDLWGPLLLCLLLSIILSIGAPKGQEMLLFASVFFIFWVGSAVVTFNAQLLGGKISFFQSVCVLGYCMFPLNIGSVLCYLWSNWIWRVVVTSVCLFWSTRASIVFISQMIDEKRRTLAVYPVILFYLVISWMILISG